MNAGGNVSGCVTDTSLVEHRVRAYKHIFLATKFLNHPALIDTSPGFIRHKYNMYRLKSALKLYKDAIKMECHNTASHFFFLSLIHDTT